MRFGVRIWRETEVVSITYLDDDETESSEAVLLDRKTERGKS